MSGNRLARNESKVGVEKTASEKPNKIRVLLADDHTLFRQSLAYMLRQNPALELVGEAADGGEAVAKARELQPDVVLMDIRMPHTSGLEATRLIRAELPRVNILILTVSEEGRDLVEAMKAGAKGYMLKNVDASRLLEAIRLIAGGDVVVSAAVADDLLRELSAPPPQAERPVSPSPSGLTQRECGILKELAKGKSNRDIGLALGISENTVRAHLRSILEKLHLQNRIQAAAYAIKEGLSGDNPPDGDPNVPPKG
ncbi:MAG: response regulator [Chloroflexota bacterium]